MYYALKCPSNTNPAGLTGNYLAQGCRNLGPANCPTSNCIRTAAVSALRKTTGDNFPMEHDPKNPPQLKDIFEHDKDIGAELQSSVGVYETAEVGKRIWVQFTVPTVPAQTIYAKLHTLKISITKETPQEKPERFRIGHEIKAPLNANYSPEMISEAVEVVGNHVVNLTYKGHEYQVITKTKVK